jgi:hypothetical protein
MSVITESVPRVSSIDIKAKTKPEAAYYGTVVYINHLLDLSAQIKSVVKKNQILLRMFSHLIANPTILIHVPFFRNSILGKIHEIEEHIIARKNKMICTKYSETLETMRRSIEKRIRYSDRKRSIIGHLNILTDEIDNYNFWVESAECLAVMKTLRAVIEDIKDHPEYASE